MGLSVNVEMIWGTMFLPNSGGAWLLGLIIHLMVSGIAGLIYAAAFEFITYRASAALGAAFSLVHSVIAGVSIGMLPAIHPRIPEAVPAPGVFMSAMGLTGVVGLFVLHAIYGAIGGSSSTQRHVSDNALTRDRQLRESPELGFSQGVS